MKIFLLCLLIFICCDNSISPTVEIKSDIVNRWYHVRETEYDDGVLDFIKNYDSTNTDNIIIFTQSMLQSYQKQDSGFTIETVDYTIWGDDVIALQSSGNGMFNWTVEMSDAGNLKFTEYYLTSCEINEYKIYNGPISPEW